jgi:hypothetical protein
MAELLQPCDRCDIDVAISGERAARGQRFEPLAGKIGFACAKRCCVNLGVKFQRLALAPPSIHSTRCCMSSTC